MMQQRGGLGRGLAALLGEATGLREIALDEIRPNSKQPRREFDLAELEELAASIRSVGLLQPVVVRRDGDGYELIVGERRVRAARIAGLDRIPAVVRDAGDGEMLRAALIENLQRADLNPLDEAAAYRQLLDELGVTHEELSTTVGKSRAAVTNALRLLALAPEALARVRSGAISAAHGRTIASLDDPAAQARAAARVVAERLSVRETEDLVRRMAGPARAPETRPPAVRPAGILEAEANLSDILETRVRIEGGRRRGRIVIDFAGLEDLARIVGAMTPGE